MLTKKRMAGCNFTSGLYVVGGIETEMLKELIETFDILKALQLIGCPWTEQHPDCVMRAVHKVRVKSANTETHSKVFSVSPIPTMILPQSLIHFRKKRFRTIM